MFGIRGISSVVQDVLSELRCGNRVQPLEELPQVLPSGGCMLHGLLLHCPVSHPER